MVRFPSVLYPFSILLIFSSSDRLLLYRTCHRCAANARIYAVSIFWIRIANIADLLIYLFYFAFSKFNIEWSWQVLRNTRHQAVYSIWQLLVRFIARLHRNLIFIRSGRIFARNLLLLPTNDSDKFQNFDAMKYNRKLQANFLRFDIWSRNIRDLTRYIIVNILNNINRLLRQRKKQNS